MDATETEFARQWGDWLRAKLANKGWKGADLRRAVEAVGGSVGPSQISRWTNGDQRPSVKNAGLVADALGVDRREAWKAAGLDGEVGATDGPIVVAARIEVLLDKIRARGFPAEMEETLIARVRAEIDRRRRWEEQEDALLDTVEAAMGKTPDEP